MIESSRSLGPASPVLVADVRRRRHAVLRRRWQPGSSSLACRPSRTLPRRPDPVAPFFSAAAPPVRPPLTNSITKLGCCAAAAGQPCLVASRPPSRGRRPVLVLRLCLLTSEGEQPNRPRCYKGLCFAECCSARLLAKPGYFLICSIVKFG